MRSAPALLVCVFVYAFVMAVNLRPFVGGVGDIAASVSFVDDDGVFGACWGTGLCFLRVSLTVRFSSRCLQMWRPRSTTCETTKRRRKTF